MGTETDKPKSWPGKKTLRKKKIIPQNAKNTLLSVEKYQVTILTSAAYRKINFDYNYYESDTFDVGAWGKAAQVFCEALDILHKQNQKGKYQYVINFETFGHGYKREDLLFRSDLKTNYFCKYFELAIYSILKPQHQSLIAQMEKALKALRKIV